MLDGLADNELDRYLEENPWIVPLFEIDVVEVVISYVSGKELKTEKDPTIPDVETVLELRSAQEAVEKEMVISQWVKAPTLEEINLGTIEEPRLVNVAKEIVKVNMRKLRHNRLNRIATKYKHRFNGNLTQEIDR